MSSSVVQMNKLKEWTQAKAMEILYDSDYNSYDNRMVNSLILHKSNLCFVIVDSNDNVFGCYQPSSINETGQTLDNSHWYFDKQHFLFKLSGNDGVSHCPIRWNIRKGKSAGMKLYGDDTRLFSIGSYEDEANIIIKKFGNECVCQHLNSIYEMSSQSDLNNHPNEKQRETNDFQTSFFFTIKRILIIQMY